MKLLKRKSGSLVVLALAGLPLAALAQDYGVDMPAEPAPGVRFPTPEAEIDAWIRADPQDTDAIHAHAWGIWAGLTKPVEGEGAYARLTYQTWLTKADVIDVFTGEAPEDQFRLGESNQMFKHGLVDGFIANNAQEKKDGTEPVKNAAGIIVNTDVLENVAYSPPSAQYLLDTGTGKPEVLDRLLELGDKVRFPDAAVNVKPVYKLITDDRITEWTGEDGRTRRLYAFTAWPGEPDLANWTPDMKQGGYPETLWQQCVYVDLDLQGPTTSTGVDVNCKSPSEGNIYSVDDFIAVDLKKEDAAFVNKATGESRDLTAGKTSIALLVAMHVTSRETTQWTWQTFWWEADAARPNSPSSAAVASARPDPGGPLRDGAGLFDAGARPAPGGRQERRRAGDGLQSLPRGGVRHTCDRHHRDGADSGRLWWLDHNHDRHGHPDQLHDLSRSCGLGWARHGLCREFLRAARLLGL